MVILKSQNKITDFLMILAWASPFNNRIMKCRRSFYSLSGCGMCFPGFNVDIRKYIWDSVCVSTLKYGLETMYLSNTQIKKLESLQGIF